MVKEIKLSSNKIVDQSFNPQDIVSLVLKNRKIKDASDFLSPEFPVMTQLSASIKKAVKIIKSAIINNQNILIYGDYDVDGITATAILWHSIYKSYKNVTPFVPHREKDGYGIKAESFFRFQKEKGIIFDLLITVDNGIVAEKELAKIKSRQNIKVIVTDHHLAGKKIIAVDVVITSTKICGASISWFLAKEFDKDADLGLASLGTVADCLPLTGVNRSIVVHGLQSLRLNPSPGVRKLINVSGIKQDLISAYDLGFILGPRINAVGRLSDPTDALRLLCSQNILQASHYAAVLNNYNQDRQILQKESLEIADQNINLKEKLIFISGNFNPGIIGLIAGRLTEKYYLPSIVIGVDGDLAKGSCRSIPELNIIESLRQYSDLFIDLGGHAGAAGFSIITKNIPKIKISISKLINSKLNKLHLSPHLDVDAEMTLGAITLKNIKALESLAPFGIGNPEPLFLFKNITVNNIRTIGQTNDHLKFEVRVDRCVHPISCLAFKKGELITSLKNGDTVDFVASLSENIWNNISTPQLIVKEIII
jgi:single-stranded-DNA-specific exonuclease